MTDYLNPLRGWGQNGVDIFFVISGFVMIYTQDQRPKDALAFLRARIRRIAPLYWIMTGAIIAIHLVLPSAFGEQELSLGYAISSLFFVAGPIVGDHPLVHVGWTLEWEMLFYVLFGGLLIFNSKKWHTALVIAGLVIVTIVSGDLIVLEFGMGMVLAEIYLRFRLSSWTGLVLLIAGSVLLTMSVGREIPLARFFVWGIPSFLIVLGLTYLPQIRSKIAVYLGDASYSIYLVQILTIPVFFKASSALSLDLPGDALAIVCTLGSTLAGCILYSLIEKPVSDRMRQSKRPPLVANGIPLP